jgi:hypothetical protein
LLNSLVAAVGHCVLSAVAFEGDQRLGLISRLLSEE